MRGSRDDGRPHDLWVSALTATLVELPLAVILITTALRILRLTVTRLWLLDPGMPPWRLPLLDGGSLYVSRRSRVDNAFVSHPAWPKSAA
jgi:hypothetical protein